MENSKIEWTDHTFNPWIGCEKVSPGCANCYAEAQDHRWNRDYRWGKGRLRDRTSSDNWHKVTKWDREAKADGVIRKVFVASMADWLDPSVPEAWRADLMTLIKSCQNLVFLMLTKRPEFLRQAEKLYWPGGPLKNVWLGATVEDQKRLKLRVPLLKKVNAVKRFLSVEPLLERVSFRWMIMNERPNPTGHLDILKGIHQVIVGGESGVKARPFVVDWARSLRDECREEGVSFFMKQMGAWVMDHNDQGFDGDTPSQWPDTVHPERKTEGSQGDLIRVYLSNIKGNIIDDFPADLRIREFPQ